MSTLRVLIVSVPLGTFLFVMPIEQLRPRERDLIEQTLPNGSRLIYTGGQFFELGIRVDQIAEQLAARSDDIRLTHPTDDTHGVLMHAVVRNVFRFDQPELNAVLGRTSNGASDQQRVMEAAPSLNISLTAPDDEFDRTSAWFGESTRSSNLPVELIRSAGASFSSGGVDVTSPRQSNVTGDVSPSDYNPGFRAALRGDRLRAIQAAASNSR